MNPERHLVIFYISQIIVIFLLDKVFSSLEFSGLIGFLLKLFIFALFSLVSVIAIYGILAMKLCRNPPTIKRPIEFEDILLTSSAIVTTFLVPDLFSTFALFSQDISFILTIVVGIPATFLLVYWTSFWIAGSLY